MFVLHKIGSNYLIKFLKYKRKHLLWPNLLRTNYSTNQFTQKPLNVLFFGNDNFSLETLKALVKEKRLGSNIISQIGVVTSHKSKIKSVEQFAKSNELKCFYWPIEVELCRLYDIGIVTSFGHLIPEHIISAFPHGMINVHGSLLPRWRGAAPTIYALLHGDKTTGVTIMNIRPKHFDVGEIIAQHEIPISPHMLLPELNHTLATIGGELLCQCLRQFPLNGRKQNETDVTYAPRVPPLFGQINWTEMTAERVYNLYRALYSFQPILTKWHESVVKLLDISLDSHCINSSDSLVSENNVPGTIIYVKSQKCLKILCADRNFIVVSKLMVGPKTMSAADFNNGFLKKVTTDKRYFE